jgi:hypothetical protein
VNRLFALVNDGGDPIVDQRVLHDMALALEANAADFCRAWGLEWPAVVAVGSPDGLPHGCHPVVFTSSLTDPGTLAFHYWDATKFEPAARVLTNNTSGINSGVDSMSEAASHEILEILADPTCDLWSRDPVDPTRKVAFEVCDPVQDAYTVEVRGTPWIVSNFVTREWFNPNPRTNTFDFLRTLERPGQIGPEGYAIYERNGDTWQEFGPRYSLKKARAAHQWGRSLRRLTRTSPWPPKTP